MTRAKNGYTLLEVLVAAVILAVILPALIMFVTSSRRTQNSSLIAETASSLAQRSFDSLAQMPRAVRTEYPTSGAPQKLTVNGHDYNLFWSYQTAPPNSYGGVNPGAITLKVTFPSGSATRETRLEGVLP